MKIHFTFKDITVTEALKKYAEEKFKKIEKHFEKEPVIHLILKHQNSEFVAEAEVREGPFSAFASEKAPNLEVAIDGVVDELQRQLHKKIDKVRDRRREEKYAVFQQRMEEDEEEETIEYKVVKPEVYAFEDARLLLDEYGGAIVFINQDTGKVSILHRTAQGRLELIEIDM